MNPHFTDPIAMICSEPANYYKVPKTAEGINTIQ